MDKITENWELILNKIKFEHDVSDVAFRTWLLPLELYSVEENVVTILVPDEHFMSYIIKKYDLPFQVAISELTGENYTVSFVLAKDVSVRKPAEKKQAKITDPRYEEAHLNPKYTFDTFVVGSNNKLAQAACLAAAESPGETYNPLYLYGGPGLGKTHLMHSIAHYILDNNEDMKVIYVTSEDFTNEVIECIRVGNTNPAAMARFREKYRGIDVFMVDDIQFIIGKDSTQEEFFHTFNTLHAAGKQIIISSDKPPKEMVTLAERFRTRFEMGLIADITPPDYETRMAILHKKEEMDGFVMKDEIIQYIAENVKSSIRELEGAFNRIVARSRLEKQEITLEVAQQILTDFISPNEHRTITPEHVLSVIAEHYNVTVKDLEGKKRNNKIVEPRHIAMYLIRELTDASLKTIGQCLGNRDHTTILNGVNNIEAELAVNEKLKSTISVLKKKINPQN